MTLNLVKAMLSDYVSGKVSVIIPAYNAADYILETLESLRAQTFENFEVIIVDDLSSDSTWKIVSDYCLCDSRFRCFKNHYSKGVSGAANYAFSLSNGEFIVRSDADDLSAKHRLASLVEFFIANPAISICGSWIRTFGRIQDNWSLPLGHSSIAAEMLFRCAVFQPTIAVRRDVFVSFSYREDLKSAEDYELWVRILESGKYRFANIPDFLVLYRLHLSNTTVVLAEETSRNFSVFQARLWSTFGLMNSSCPLPLVSVAGQSSFKMILAYLYACIAPINQLCKIEDGIWFQFRLRALRLAASSIKRLVIKRF